MATKWDERFDVPDYVYGQSPNKFFSAELDVLNPGKLLMPAEGEGRNAVYAASKRWQVTAVDESRVARSKALMLAEQQGVALNYEISDLSNYTFGQNKYDAVGIVFLHLPEEVRKKVHASIVSCLKPGGKLIMEVFSQKQLGNKTGGPQNMKLLYSLEYLKRDFETLSFLKIEEDAVFLSEGYGHNGRAETIRLVAQKDS